MIFYQIATPTGPQLVRTQAEAKGLDEHFFKVDIPIGQAELMAYLNTLLRSSASTADAEAGEEEPAPMAATPAASTPPLPPRNPPVTRMYDQIGFEQFVHDLPASEAHRLDVLAECIANRKREITGTGK